jgi:hypothetical protein
MTHRRSLILKFIPPKQIVTFKAWWRGLAHFELRPLSYQWITFYRFIAGIVLCVALIFTIIKLFRATPNVDIYPTYVAATLANEGLFDHVYHPSIWLIKTVDAVWDKRCRELGIWTAGTSFIYHPWYLYAVRPIVARVSYVNFQIASQWLNIIFLFIIGYTLNRLLGGRTLLGQLLLTLLLANAPPTSYGMSLGQNILLTLGFALLAVSAWLKGLPFWVGCLWVMMAWICKPWAMLLLPLCLLLRGARTFILTSLISGMIMVVLPEIVLPQSLLQNYHAMQETLTGVSTQGWNNLSLLSLLERSCDHHWVRYLYDWEATFPRLFLRLYSLAVAAAVACASGLAVWRRCPDGRYTAAAFLAFILLPLGICWTHYLIFALPLAFILMLGTGSTWHLRIAGFFLTSMLMVPQNFYLEVLPQKCHTPVQRALMLEIRALPMFLIIFAILVTVWTAPRAIDSPEA